MKPADLALIHAFLDDTIEAAGLESLQSLLRSDAEARRTLRGMAAIDAKLEQLAAGDAEILHTLGPTKHAEPGVRKALDRWKTFAAAVTGAVVTLGCMSIVFAYVPASFGSRGITILREGFESGPAPRTDGMPVVPGVWAGDRSRVVGPQPGLDTAEGTRMLQLLRADYEGKPQQLGYAGDIYRIIDLRRFEPLIADGKAAVVVDAGFGSIANDCPGRYRCGISMNTIASLPEIGGEAEVARILEAERDSLSASSGTAGLLSPYSPASVHRSLVFPNGSANWQRLRISMPVSSGTPFVIVKFEVTDSEASDKRLDSSEVEFPGQFLDDIRVTLVREPVQP